MYKIIYTQSYEKRAGKFLRKHPEIKNQYEKTLKLLKINPAHPSLRLHKLEGKFSELYSISINISYRISLEIIIKEKELILVDIGTHNEVYGK